MLDQKDIDILKGMLESVIDERLTKSEITILHKVDEKLAASETAILLKMDEKLAASETAILLKIDEKLAKSENIFLRKVDKKLAKSENMLLEEVERTRNILESIINKVKQNLDELDQYYKITKLGNDNTALLLKLIDDLSKRVEDLEKKTA